MFITRNINGKNMVIELKSDEIMACHIEYMKQSDIQTVDMFADDVMLERCHVTYEWLQANINKIAHYFREYADNNIEYDWLVEEAITNYRIDYGRGIYSETDCN